MSDMRLKMIPAALAAMGMITAGVQLANATPASTGVPPAAVYTNSLFAPTAFISLGWHAEIPAPNLGGGVLSTTAGLIALMLKPALTGWLFHISDGNFSASTYGGTHTLTATYAPSTTSSATCTLTMTVDYDRTNQLMGVSIGTASISSGSASACHSRYTTLTGLSSSVFGGSKTNYNLLY